MREFNKYRSTQIAEMREYEPGEDMSEISNMFEVDPLMDLGMIARAASDPNDLMYISREYFQKNFEKV